MHKTLQDKLFKKYPKIFRQRYYDIKESAMPWGFECSDGWYWLLDNLCSKLQWDIDKNKQPQIEATQVKEKFGGLRFYTAGETERQDGMISLAMHMSNSICEECGSTEGVEQTTQGWIRTLCKECKTLANEKDNNTTRI